MLIKLSHLRQYFIPKRYIVTFNTSEDFIPKSSPYNIFTLSPFVAAYVANENLTSTIDLLPALKDGDS